MVDGIDAARGAQLVLGRLDEACLVHGARLQEQFRAVPVELVDRSGAAPSAGSGPSIRAVCQLRPPSSETSTRLIVPLPDQARPVTTVRPLPWVIGACGLGLVMTDLTSITQVKRRALPLASRSVYFEVSSRVLPGLVADLQAAQPLDPHVAFPAGHDEPHRIALFGPQRLAVHLAGDQAVVERLLHRDRAGHRGGIGAFGQQPFARRS